MTKISVIVPVYGVEKYLKKCLDSILAQTFNDFELILLDDGSKDNCPKIIDEYAEKDKRIKPVHKQNGGYGHTCNMGLSLAVGEYISIIEPDDYIDPNMFEDLYKIAKQYDSDIVKSAYYDNLVSKTRTDCFCFDFWGEKIPTDISFTISEFPNFLAFHPSIWSCLYKKDFLDKNNIRFVEAKGAGWTDNPFQVQTMCLAKKINYTHKGYYYWLREDESFADACKDWTLPVKRSAEIHEWLDKNNITDEKILGSLFKRELDYITYIMDKRYSFKEFLYAMSETKKMISRMDEKILENNEFTHPFTVKDLNAMKKNIYMYYFKVQLKKLRRTFLSIRLNKQEFRIIVFGHCFRRVF